MEGRKATAVAGSEEVRQCDIDRLPSVRPGREGKKRGRRRDTTQKKIPVTSNSNPFPPNFDRRTHYNKTGL